jgi:hypothetical protein
MMDCWHNTPEDWNISGDFTEQAGPGNRFMEAQFSLR